MFRSAQAGLLAAGLLLACSEGRSIPGEILGEFKFDAEPQTIGCTFSEIPDGGFVIPSATLSVVDGGPEAYLTFDDVSRQGTFDGQRFEYTYPGPQDDPVFRTFEQDACGNRFVVQETLRAVFLTAAQFGSMDGGCASRDPEELFDAGGPNDPDAGILPPSRGPDRFDAESACGVLIENVSPAEQCDFLPCTLTYRIQGARIQQ